LMDRVWSVDALYDNGAMSKYATLTSIAESPVQEGVLYTGSDDGLIHMSSDGGGSWTKSAALPKVPARSFINDIEASHHDTDEVFAVVDAHKEGDYSPYIFKSSNRGKTWTSISGDLPKGTSVWVLKQDHEDENLLFIGTEFGLYFSYNKGKNWVPLKKGVPTISFRDIELHPRDNDLVGATFGRGFYVLDDYSTLRELSSVSQDANTLFSVRDAWWYIPSEPMQAKGMPTLGSSNYVADNPPFGAIFSYQINQLTKTVKETRKASEKASRTKNADAPFPGWDKLSEERSDQKPQVLLLIKDDQGTPIRWIKGRSKKGLHRTNWDLRLAAPNPINLSTPAFKPPWAGDPKGPLASPGTYTVELYIEHNGALTQQGTAQSFTVKPMPGAEETDSDFKAVATFQQQTADLMRDISSASQQLSEVNERLRFIKEALTQTPNATAEHFNTFHQIKTTSDQLRTTLSGDPVRRGLDESTSPSISGRVGQVIYGHWDTRQMPTKTFEDNIKIAVKEYAAFVPELTALLVDLERYEGVLKVIGAPFTRGRR